MPARWACAPWGHRDARHWARDRTRTRLGRRWLAAGPGPPVEGWPGFLAPVCHGCLAALASPPRRLLWAPAPGFEQTAHLDGMVEDAKREANHRGDPSAGPHLAPEAVGFGSTVQEVGPTGQLFGGQPAGGAGAWAVPEGFRSLLAGTRHPWADSPFADGQGGGGLPLGPALLQEVPGLESSGFLPIFG
jgi:hypothetical protein